MEQAAENGSGSVAGRDWSALPEDLLVSVLRALHVADAVRSGAVRTSWNAAYAAFRRHRVPSPRQPPCLLYASDAVGPGAAVLHCPATGATLRLPFPLARRRPLLGSGHGWLVTADKASNLHLVNPITGARAALPPITAIHHVKMGTDEHGGPAYNVYEDLLEYDYDKDLLEVDSEPTILDIDQAYWCMYDRVVLSASPAAGHACAVLLLHMPQGEVSFARLGDERWTWVEPGDATGLPWRFGYTDAMYSATDGLFYLLENDASMFSLDLNGPSPVVRKMLDAVPKSGTPTKYLVQTPAGDILQVWRMRDYVHSPTSVQLPPDYMDDQGANDQFLELKTIDLQIYRVDPPGTAVGVDEELARLCIDSWAQWLHVPSSNGFRWVKAELCLCY